MRELWEELVRHNVERYGKHTRGLGWYSFDHGGVHFIGVVDVLHLKGGGLGTLGSEQLKWLEADVEGLPASTPIVVFAHIPEWSVNAAWGGDTPACACVRSCLQRFGFVIVLDGQFH